VRTDRDPALLFQEEAESFLQSVSDPATKQLLAIAYAEVRRRFEEKKNLPVSDFDLLFFMERMKEFFSKADELRRILSVENLAADWEF
jgi:hypothetical protein